MQLSDAISIIGREDFPQKWPDLLTEMVTRFQSGDFHIINGILRTAHSLFKRWDVLDIHVCPLLKCVKNRNKRGEKALEVQHALCALFTWTCSCGISLICVCVKYSVCTLYNAPTDIVMSLSPMSYGVRLSWFSTHLHSPWQSSSRYVISCCTIYESYLGITTHWWHVIVRSTYVGFNWAPRWRLVLYVHCVSNLSRFYFRPLLSFVRPMPQMSMPSKSSFPP